MLRTNAMFLFAGLFTGAITGVSLTTLADGTTSLPSFVDREFAVSAYEVNQRFAFGDKFKGSYDKTFTLTDGSTRHVRLQPVVRENGTWIEFRDNEGRTFMGSNSFTVNQGNLLVHVLDWSEARSAE